MFKVCQQFLTLSKIIIDRGLKFLQKPRWPTSKSIHAFLLTVPHLYQLKGNTVPPGESQVLNDKDWDTYEAANPKHCGRASTFINILHVPFNKREVI